MIIELSSNSIPKTCWSTYGKLCFDIFDGVRVRIVRLMAAKFRHIWWNIEQADLWYDNYWILQAKKNKQDPNCGSSESFVWMLLMRLGCFLCKYCSGFCMSRVVSTWVCFWGLCEYFAVILLRRNEVVCIWVLLLRFERFCVNIAFEVWSVLCEYFTGFCMRPMHLWTGRGQAAWDAVIS